MWKEAATALKGCLPIGDYPGFGLTRVEMISCEVRYSWRDYYENHDQTPNEGYPFSFPLTGCSIIEVLMVTFGILGDELGASICEFVHPTKWTPDMSSNNSGCTHMWTSIRDGSSQSPREFVDWNYAYLLRFWDRWWYPILSVSATSLCRTIYNQITQATFDETLAELQRSDLVLAPTPRPSRGPLQKQEKVVG